MFISKRSRKEQLFRWGLLALLLVSVGWSASQFLYSSSLPGMVWHLAWMVAGVFFLWRGYGRWARSVVSRALIPVQLRRAGRRNRRSHLR